MPVGHLHFLSGKKVYSVLPFLKLGYLIFVVVVVVEVYELFIYVRYQSFFGHIICKYFLLSIYFLFILLMISFAVQKLFVVFVYFCFYLL